MDKYIIATIKDWNINQYNKSVYKKSKNWYLVTDSKKLTITYVKSIKPKYIFFPHWSNKVNSKIINNYECVCFHETNVPYGRGGSPIQNLFYAVCVPDYWLNEMIEGDMDKRKTWAKVLENRQQKGLPYIFFTDNINRNKPQV